MTLSDRTPPQDLEAEQAVLGAMMMGDKDAIEDAREILSRTDFYRPQHEQIYSAITDLHDQRHPVDAVTVADELGRRGEVSKVGGAPYLHTLLASAPISANAGWYAAIVREKAALRRTLDVATRINQGVYDGGESEAVIDRAMAEMAGIPLRTAAGSAWEDIFPRVLEGLDSTEPQGLSLPWPELDRVIHGLRRKNLYLIAARPKVGKSVMGLNIATHVAEVHRKTALYFTLEMSEEELGLRIIADKADIPLGHLVDRNLNDFEAVKIGQLYRDLDGLPLEVHDSAYQTVSRINAVVREASRRTDLGVVVIDYLGLVTAEDTKATREQQVAGMSRSFKILSDTYDVPVVVLVQLNRALESRPDKTPQAHDMRDSGGQEQDATAAILLWRPPEDPGVLNAYVALNRHGEQAIVELEFWGHKARIDSPEAKNAREARKLRVVA